MSPSVDELYPSSFERNFLRLPVDWIADNPRIGSRLAKAVWWFLFPLQCVVFVLSPGKLSNGIAQPVATLLLLTLAVFVVSCGLSFTKIGFLSGDVQSDFSERVRKWSITLFTTWGVTLVLLLLWLLARSFIPARPLIEECAPFITYLANSLKSYLVLSLFAVLTVAVAPRLLRYLGHRYSKWSWLAPYQSQKKDVFAPNLLMIVGIDTLLTVVFFSLPQLSLLHDGTTPRPKCQPPAQGKIQSDLPNLLILQSGGTVSASMTVIRDR